jgi:hypothetical protein
MIPTLTLPSGTTVAEAADRCRVALDELAAVQPTQMALAHWLATSYRDALVSSSSDHPFALRLASSVDIAIEAVQRSLRAFHDAACVDGNFVSRLPARVPVVRIRDEHGDTGFGPIDVRGASLEARGLSLFLAHYLMRPEAYLVDGNHIAAE